jgi:putative transposase
MMNKPLPRRKSMRLKNYDYSQNGGYFITICTHHRACLFGDIMDGVMVLNDVGRIVETEWLKTETLRNDVTLDEFVIMPNHIHMILFLVGGDCIRPNIKSNGTMQSSRTDDDHNATITNGRTQSAPTVGQIVRGFKSSCTKLFNQYHQTQGVSVWQRGYYDHIIRNEADLMRIRQYIINNPLQWDFDKNNPKLMSGEGKGNIING